MSFFQKDFTSTLSGFFKGPSFLDFFFFKKHIENSNIFHFYGKQEIPKDNKSGTIESFGPCSNPFTYLNFSER